MHECTSKNLKKLASQDRLDFNVLWVGWSTDQEQKIKKNKNNKNRLINCSND